MKQLGHEIEDNERLEFLGDAVVELVVCDIMFRNYPKYSEGDMAKVKGAVASEEILAQIAKKIDLGRYVLIGKGEEKTGGRKRDSILADTFEALCGAIYMDAGFEKVKEIIGKFFVDYIKEYLLEQKIFDYKTALQEITQERFKSLPYYKFVGNDSDGRFIVELYISGKKYSTGVGYSKKDAEKQAAKETFEKLTSNG